MVTAINKFRVYICVIKKVMKFTLMTFKQMFFLYNFIKIRLITEIYKKFRRL